MEVYGYITSTAFLLTLGCCTGENLNKTITNRFVVSIAPSAFEKVITSDQKLFFETDNPNNTTESFLDSFHAFLLTFDFKTDSDESYLQLKRICMATAAYNKQHQPSKPQWKYIKLWIAIIPHGKVNAQVELASLVIRETNLVFNRTVRAFLLNYRSQRIGLQSLPIMKQDIQISQDILQKNARFGIILDVRNCFGSDIHFRNLVQHPVDLVIYQPYGTDIELNRKLEIASMIPCILRFYQPYIFQRLPIYVYKLPVEFKVNLQNNTFWIDVEPLPEMVNVGEGEFLSITVIEAVTETVVSNVIGDPVMRSQESKEKWLRTESEFNKQYTGVVVYDEYQQVDTKTLLPSIFKTFCKIMVIQREPAPNDMRHMTKFVTNLLQYTTDAMKTKRFNSQCRERNTEIILAVNTFQNDSNDQYVDTNEAIISNITAIVKETETVNPNISVTLLFSWNTCYGIEGCENAPILDGESYKHSSYVNVFTLFLNDARRIINNTQFQNQPKLGVMLNWQFCFDIDDHNYYSAFSELDILIFKFSIDIDSITESGALAMSSDIISILQVCSVYTEGLALFQQSRGRTFSYSYSVVIYGCDAASNNLTELIEVTRFWELINQWALSVDTKVYIGSAVEDATSHESKDGLKCSEENPNSFDEACDCGWWRALPNERLDGLILEKKKTIALKLFQQNDKINQTNDRSEESQTGFLLSILLPVTVIITAILTLAVIMIFRHRMKHQFSKTDVEHFFRGYNFDQNEHTGSVVEMSSLHESKPYDRERYEISPSKFKIDYSRILGSGECGKVYRGIIMDGQDDKNVAVKMIKKLSGERSHGDNLALKGLISEIKLLTYVGEHKNVIKLIGAYTSKLKIGKLLVFLELCEMGSLFTYVRKCNVTNDVNEKSDYASVLELKPKLDSKLISDMHRWSKEIVIGMEFLSSKKIVHADLATRNVLLDSNKCAKISDFGLSRRLYDYTEYVKREQAPLPWRWMAPESLKKMVFNEKTDVWAYGVTLWEIFTLGDEPYPGLNWDINFPGMLERGLRLQKPRYNDKEIFSIMKQCWKANSNERPTFTELRSMLSNL